MDRSVVRIIVFREIADFGFIGFVYAASDRLRIVREGQRYHCQGYGRKPLGLMMSLDHCIK